MSTLSAMFFEKMFSASPLRLNPFVAILLQVVLVYLPHFLRKPLVAKILKEKKIEFTLANSRLLSKLAADDSPDGRKLATFIACHENSLEALIYFSASVLAAMVAKVDRGVIEQAGALFIAFRVLFTIVYLTKLNGPLRSVVFLIALQVPIGLLLCSVERYLMHNAQ